MERTEHTKIIQELHKLVAPENQASATELLTQLSNDYEETTTKMEKASTDIEKLTANFEHLRQVNADLFLQVGVTKKENKETIETPTEENTISVEDLFDEKGELK